MRTITDPLTRLVLIDEDQWTCGNGVAASAGLPRKLADLMAALADTLDEHRRALDPTDAAARQEDATYTRVIARQRAAVEALRASADEMERARDTPMGRHDQATMTDPSLMSPYRRFLDLERDLIEMFRGSIADGEAMLREERED